MIKASTKIVENIFIYLKYEQKFEKYILFNEIFIKNMMIYFIYLKHSQNLKNIFPLMKSVSRLDINILNPYKNQKNNFIHCKTEQKLKYIFYLLK